MQNGSHEPAKGETIRNRRSRVHRLPITAAIMTLGGVVSTTLAQTVGPGTVTSTVNVGSGTTTIVGGTSVTPSGTAVLVTGGTLIVDPAAGASPGAVTLSATNFNAFAIYALGGTVNLGSGGITLTTAGGAASALWTQNTNTSAVSTGGLGIHTTGGYGNVGGLPVGSYGAVASHNSSISLTNATILTEGVGATGAYAFGGRITLNNVAVETRGEVYSDSTGNYGAYGLLSNALNGVRGSATINGGTFLTAGRTGYGLIAIGSDITATGVTVATNGSAAYAVFANNGSTITGTGLTVTANGPSGYGAYAVGGSTITLRDSTFKTTGATGYNLLSYGANSRLSAENVIVTTTNSGAPGVTAWGTTATDNVRVSLTGGAVQTQGSGSHGLYVRGALALGEVNGTTVTTSGQGAFAARVINGTLNTGNATIQANGVNAVGLGVSSDTGLPAKVTMTGGSLSSAQSDAIAVSSGSAQVTLNGTTVSGAPNWLHTMGTTSLSAFPLPAPDTVTPVVNASATDIPGVGVLTTLGPVEAPSAAPTSAVTVVASSAVLTGAALTDVGTTSSVSLKQGTVWNLTGNSSITTLTNETSQILFSAPVAGAFKTLTATNYTGTNGLIRLNTYLGADGSPSDRLVVEGSADGATLLRIANAGGPGQLTQTNGIMVVNAVNGGTTAAGAFALDGRAVAGPYEYRLFRGSSSSAADQNWYLRSEQTPVPPPPVPPVPPDPPAPPSPPEPVKPLYRPEVAAYLANQRLAGQMFVHSLHDRLGEPQYVEGQGFNPAEDKARSGWLRMVGKWEGSRSADNNFKTSTDSFLLHGGAELAKWKLANEADRLHLGVMGSYGYASTDAVASGNPFKARGKVEGWSVGAYGTWYQNDEQKLGAYVDTWFQYGWFSNRVEGDQLPSVKYNATGWSVSGETGYAMPLRNDWVAEPQAQLIYVGYNEDNIAEPNGTQVSGADSHGWISRLGIRLHRTYVRQDSRKVQPYVTLNWWHTKTDSNISFNQLPLGSLYPQNRYELKLGVNVDFGKRWTGWSNVSGAWGAQSFYQYALRVGVKYAW